MPRILTHISMLELLARASARRCAAALFSVDELAHCGTILCQESATFFKSCNVVLQVKMAINVDFPKGPFRPLKIVSPMSC